MYIVINIRKEKAYIGLPSCKTFFADYGLLTRIRDEPDTRCRSSDCQIGCCREWCTSNIPTTIGDLITTYMCCDTDVTVIPSSINVGIKCYNCRDTRNTGDIPTSSPSSIDPLVSITKPGNIVT